MRPRTLAKLALKWVESGEFLFDNDDRKEEAIKQLKRIIGGKATEENNPEDPITEIWIRVYIPNFDYPIVPTDNWGNIKVWKEDGKYTVDGRGTHTVSGIGLSGAEYYMGFLYSLAPYRNAVIKVDKYTDVKRAAYALVCSLTQVLNKKDQSEEIMQKPVKMQGEILEQEYKKHKDVIAYEQQQKKMYVQWLTQWINTYKSNPETHMKVLKMFKKASA